MLKKTVQLASVTNTMGLILQVADVLASIQWSYIKAIFKNNAINPFKPNGLCNPYRLFKGIFYFCLDLNQIYCKQTKKLLIRCHTF